MSEQPETTQENSQGNGCCCGPDCCSNLADLLRKLADALDSTSEK